MNSKLSPKVLSIARLFQKHCGFGLPFSGNDEEMCEALDKAFKRVREYMDERTLVKRKLDMIYEAVQTTRKDI